MTKSPFILFPKKVAHRKPSTGVDDSKRELFKKVISHMTIGIDVSSLFGEMVMFSATSNIILKKMCYLYLGNYAKGG